MASGKKLDYRSRYVDEFGKDKETKTHESWRSMILRCYNAKTNGASRYLGRGIIVCEEWMGKNGISVSALKSRLQEKKWSPQKTFETLCKPRKKR